MKISICTAVASFVGLALVSQALEAKPLTPVNLEKLNSEKDEDDPHPSSNNLQLFYSSRAGDRLEILVSRRKTSTQAWSTGDKMPEFPSQADCRSTFLTPERKYPQFLYFATNRDPEKENSRGSNMDIYFLIKQASGGDFTSPTPVHTISSELDEAYPWLTPDGRQLYFSRKEKEGWRIYLSVRPAQGGQFGEPKPLDLQPGFRHPTLTPDGKTMIVEGPLKKERSGLFRVTRKGKDWKEPEPLTELNSDEGTTGDHSPNLSRDGSRLYFSSDRPGGKGGLDLWTIPTAFILNNK